VIILLVNDGNNDDKGCVSTENIRFRQKENTLTLNTNIFYPLLKKMKLFILAEDSMLGLDYSHSQSIQSHYTLTANIKFSSCVTAFC
jgi:hypothetical protein